VQDASRFVSVAEASLPPARHVVRRGDTLSAIGSRYGVALAELMRANGLRDASRILVGQVLVVPAGE
jgi:LysM repeat protein